MPPPRLRLQDHQRLRSSASFERIYAARKSVRQPGLLVFGLLNQLPYSRFGLSVSRKQGNAVVRNRLKRLLREAFRIENSVLPVGLDLVLIPQPGPVPSLDNFRQSLVNASRLLAKRLNRSEGESTSS